MTRTRLWLFWGTMAVYLAIVAGVLATSWLVTFDWQVMFFRPYKQWPEIHAFLDYFVVLGQRGPTAVAVAAWLGWRCWRQRNLHPLLVLGASLLLLNITVGAAKLGMGRLGPHYATVVGANEMGLGGDIFPSGHTANAVVTWGVLAYLATTSLRRRSLSVIAALGALGVGMTTVYLGTHWVSDVLLGWAAGLLVLLAMPWLEPGITWFEDRLMGVLLRLWLRLRPDSLRGPLPVGSLAPGCPGSASPLTGRCSSARRSPPARAAGPPTPRTAGRTTRHARTPSARSALRSPRRAAGDRRTRTASRAPRR